MAKMTLKLLSTCLVFNQADINDKKCYEVLNNLGCHAKLFVKTMLLTLYASDVIAHTDENGKHRIDITGKELSEQVDRYAKEYVKTGNADKSETVIFLGWDRRNDGDMTALRILIPFKGGIKDFIVDSMKRTYPLFFDEENTVPVYPKIVRSKSGNKKVSSDNKISRTITKRRENAAEASDDPVKYEKDNMIGDEDLLSMISDGWSEAINSADTKSDNIFDD